ncbi:MAG: site-specific integrase [Actinomycetota bacterium]
MPKSRPSRNGSDRVSAVGETSEEKLRQTSDSGLRLNGGGTARHKQRLSNSYWTTYPKAASRGRAITEGSPKTARGRRTIAIDSATVDALRAHRERQLVEKRAAGPAYTDLGLVFTRPNGTYVHPDLYSQTFRRVVRRLGLPYIRLHDLRHTHATLGLEAGIQVKVMSTRLGHSTTAFTQDIYMHSVPSLEESAADQIADLIFGRADAQPKDDDTGE